MNLQFAPDDCPCLPRGVRLRKDQVRGQMVLLAPEKAIELDDIGVAILDRVTGQTRFADIIADLARTYAAPAEQIEPDVQRFLMSLRARLYVMVQQ